MVIAALLGVASSRSGADEPRDLTVAIQLVKQGEFERAVLSLDLVVRRLGALPSEPRDLARAHLYMAAAYFGLEQSEKARTACLAALGADRTLRVSPGDFPPAFVAFFEAARTDAVDSQPRKRRSLGSSLLMLGAGGVAGAAVALRLSGSDRASVAKDTRTTETLASALTYSALTNGCSTRYETPPPRFAVTREGLVDVATTWTPQVTGLALAVQVADASTGRMLTSSQSDSGSLGTQFLLATGSWTLILTPGSATFCGGTPGTTTRITWQARVTHP